MLGSASGFNFRMLGTLLEKIRITNFIVTYEYSLGVFIHFRVSHCITIYLPLNLHLRDKAKGHVQNTSIYHYI